MSNHNLKKSDRLILSSVVLGGGILLFSALTSVASNYVYPKEKTNYTKKEKQIVEKMYFKIKQLENEMIDSMDNNQKLCKLAQCQSTLENINSIGLSEIDVNFIIKDNITNMKHSFFNKHRMLKKQMERDQKINEN